MALLKNDKKHGGRTSLKIISAKAETTEIKLRTVSKHEMALIKVIGNEKTS